jgi:hypothetical protein
VALSEALKQAAKRARIARIRLARVDINEFCHLVMRDEETGESIEQAPVHRAWHRLCEQHERLLIWAHIESGKSSQLSIARTLFELGQNPNLRFAIVSNTKLQAQKIATAIRTYIEKSEDLKLVFPHLKPGKPWGEHSFSVDRPSAAKDPSVQCAGIHGNVLGSRLDRLVLDDILDYENTRTASLREDLKLWYKSTLTGRLTKNSRVRLVGTAFSPSDLLHDFAKQPGWMAVRYPVINPETGEPRWPERWPLERIQKRALELGPIEARRQLFCEARDDTTAKFKREWIERCLQIGHGKDMASALKTVPRGYSVYTGVDLAVSKSDSADLTCLFTIAVDPMGNRHVLECRSGKWAGPEIIQEALSAHQRYQSILIVENNAAQDYIRQFLSASSGVPVIPFTTGRNKAHPEFGVESIGAELAAGKWVIPNHNGVCHPEIQAWIDEMLYYDPRAHTGDRLMASWFAREGIRKASIRAETGRVNWINR